MRPNCYFKSSYRTFKANQKQIFKEDKQLECIFCNRSLTSEHILLERSKTLPLPNLHFNGKWEETGIGRNGKKFTYLKKAQLS